MKIFFIIFFFFTIHFSFSQTNCDSKVCIAKKGLIDSVCENLNYNNDSIFLPDINGYCYCLCNQNLKVRTENSTYKPKVTSVLNKLNNKSVVSNSLSILLSSSEVQNKLKIYHYVLYVKLGNNKVIITEPSHLFLLSNKKLKRADRLSPIDTLVDEKLNKITIKQIVAGDYVGFITHVNTFHSKIRMNFLLTQGVLSCDSIAISKSLKNTNWFNLPQVGTNEYLLRYKKYLINENMLGVSNMIDTVKFNSQNYFIPYKKRRLSKYSKDFISRQYQKAAVGSLTTLDTTAMYYKVDTIIEFFKKAYPDVEFRIYWLDNIVNAYADIDLYNNNKKLVILYGGLLRNKNIGIEGIGLIIAHELSHHYAGKPLYIDYKNMSCEGQSDYWSTLIIERNVWHGFEAVKQIELGIPQLSMLLIHGFKVGNLFKITSMYSKTKSMESEDICIHPPDSCRIQTLISGLNLDVKPACAGCPSGTE